MSNLIKNSLDFIKKDGGIIEIGFYSHKDNYVFFVKDDGIGIETKKQANVFKKFYQADTSYTRTHGGAGLGLSICKEIVKALGGKIWLKSDLGRGTKIFFSIPITSRNKNMK